MGSLRIPGGSYPTPFLDTEFYGCDLLYRKVDTLEKGVGYEPTDTIKLKNPPKHLTQSPKPFR